MTGSTSSSNTGPDYDHTSGTGETCHLLNLIVVVVCLFCPPAIQICNLYLYFISLLSGITTIQS